MVFALAGLSTITSFFPAGVFFVVFFVVFLTVFDAAALFFVAALDVEGILDSFLGAVPTTQEQRVRRARRKRIYQKWTINQDNKPIRWQNPPQDFQFFTSFEDFAP